MELLRYTNWRLNRVPDTRRIRLRAQALYPPLGFGPGREAAARRLQLFWGRPSSLEPLRQQIYLLALRTLPNLDIILGHYLTHAVMMPLANPAPGQSRYVRVLKSEEKGSDVNLATHLVHDAHCTFHKPTGW